jgi:alkane 1-monooxygenase
LPPKPQAEKPYQEAISTPDWRDGPRKYLWLLGAIVPALVFGAWIAVQLTGSELFWWSGPILAFVVIPLLDQIVGPDSKDPPDNALPVLEDAPFYRWITYLYLPNQYLSLVFACWLWSGGGWLSMTLVGKLGLMTTVGIVGGLAINTAHEWGHKRVAAEKWLSKVALAQTCYGHFFVEHNRGHHVRVATAEDPASSRMGESLYRFIPRSVIGGLRSAWCIESKKYARIGKSRWTPKNDVLNAWLLSVVLFAGLGMWFGPVVLPWLIGQAIVGFCLLEAVNYLEHYGLQRQKRPDGRYVQVAPSHSWDVNTLTADRFLFHLQRHSDHHTHPFRRYQALRHNEEAPQLPYGYSTMLLLAVCPPLWRRVMDPRVLAHYGGDIRLAALSPRHEKHTLGRYPPRY